jgi:alkanesulfonate monooxygenase SsuD/methylene tetrahydromethanopterin reductase-like flavin-dependent oxidoreductase (luciferase family)
VQEGGVPIVVGGHSEAAARRAGRLGDGFFPLGVAPARLAHLRAVMGEAATAAGRDPAVIAVTCLGTPDAAAAEGYAARGVERMVIAALQSDLDDLRRTFSRFRTDVIDRF